MAPTAQKNKSHKARFASKGQRHKHKVAKETVNTGTAAVHRPGKSSNVNRAQRLQQAKSMRDHRRADTLQEKRMGGVSGGAPKLIALVSLSGSVNVGAIKRGLLEGAPEGGHKGPLLQDDAMQADGGDMGADMEFKGLGGQATLALQKQKGRITVVEAPGDVLSCLECAKVADIVAFVVPAEGAHIDEQGRELLTVLRALGLPATTGFIQGLDSVPLKRRSEVKKAAVATLQGQLGEDLKVHAADSPEDVKQLLRHVSELRLSPPVWRNQRPYVVADKLAFQPSDPASNGPASSGGSLLVSGYLRARALRAGQLVHVAGLGDCQLAQIDGPEDPCPVGQHRNKTGGAMEVENGGVEARVLAVAGPSDLEPLVRENEPDPTAGEQTWPTEEELAIAEEERQRRMVAKKQKRKVAKGTSEYQAAWIIDESEDEEDDADVADDGGDAAMGEAGGNADVSDAEDDVSDDEAGQGTASGRTSEVWPGDAGDAMDEDENLSAHAREEERQRLKAAARGDEEFPDEVDTPMDVPARQRFAKYRGLKSFRTSPWDPKESLPREYAQIFAFDNFRRTQKVVLAHQDKTDKESLVVPGMYVRLHLLLTSEQSNVAQEMVRKAKGGVGSLVTAMGLLQHETKMSVVHYSLKKNDAYTEPVKSKSELLFFTGMRSFRTRPIFSTDDLQMDKHKFERFLHPGRFTVASVFAPIAFPPLPLLVFKEGVNGPELVATGAQRDVDPDRVILKKIVLSGYPYRVHKRKAVVRFMFFNPEDVRWFKPLELWTKYGRRGRIKEPVGTHGSMKCVFEGVVQQRDAVCATLYKRVYPRWPESGALL